MPNETENTYINQHFDKLDKDFKTMLKASQATDLLAQSIGMMDQIKRYSNFPL